MIKAQLPQLAKSISLDPEKTLMDQLLAVDIPVASSCGGDGICGKCIVLVIPGNSTTPPKNLEKETLLKNNGGPNQRLSCQLVCKASVTVKTTYW